MMRIKLQKKAEWFDTRVDEHFAWLPVKIGREIRWLERVKYKSEYGIGWSPLYFIDEEEDEGAMR